MPEHPPASAAWPRRLLLAGLLPVAATISAAAAEAQPRLSPPPAVAPPSIAAPPTALSPSPGRIAPSARSVVLRAWPVVGEWHVFLIRTPAPELSTGCLLVTGYAEAAATPLPRVTGPSGAGTVPAAPLPIPPARQASGGSAQNNSVWGFRIVGDDLGAIVNDRETDVLDAPVIVVVADNEVAAVLPVGDHATLDSGLSAIMARATPDGMGETILGLLPLVETLTFQIVSHTYTAHFEPGGEALRQFGACRQEARLLAAARAMR